MTIRSKTPASLAEVENIADWLTRKGEQEHLSMRQMADQVGVSHATLAQAKKGVHTVATVLKIAAGFSKEGTVERTVLEDQLLALCGYRSKKPVLQTSEPMVRLIDMLSKLDDEQLRLIEVIIDFCVSLGDGTWRNGNHSR